MALFSLRTAGTLLAGIGASHFVAPTAYEPLTASVFPHDTRSWVYRNGATELALGLGLRSRKSALRKLSIVGIGAYLLMLGANAAKNSGEQL